MLFWYIRILYISLNPNYYFNPMVHILPFQHLSHMKHDELKKKIKNISKPEVSTSHVINAVVTKS
jgi:hypothetical protein